MAEKYDFDIFELLVFSFLGILFVVLMFTIFSISNIFFQGREITALSVFGTALTGVTSIILIAIYRMQTRIFRRHGEIMEKQKDLMKMEYEPNIVRSSTPSFEGDEVIVGISNVAKGYANNLKLITRMEFDESMSYESPLVGSSSPRRTSKENDHREELSLSPGEHTEIRALSLLTIDDDVTKQRAFSQVINNLAAEDVESIRVSLSVQTNAEQDVLSTSCVVLPEEHFYATISELDECNLKSVYESSNPGK